MRRSDGMTTDASETGQVPATAKTTTTTTIADDPSMEIKVREVIGVQVLLISCFRFFYLLKSSHVA